MDNETRENEILPDDRPTADIDQFGMESGADHPISEEDRISEALPPVEYGGAIVEPERPAATLVAVDPYTASPPASFRDDLVPSFGQPDEPGTWEEKVNSDDPFVPLPYSPASQGESIRQSGLAWSAGIAFFGSVAFTLFLGWIADLLLGIFPWGIVGGIVLGSIIGFLQFFRITSRIFPSKKGGPEITPLMSRKDDE